MAITVQTPAGVIEFPDGTPDADIDAALNEAHGGAASTAQGAAPVAAQPAPVDAGGAGAPSLVAGKPVTQAGPEVTYTWEGLTPEQTAAYKEYAASPGFDKTQPLGSEANPYVVHSEDGKVATAPVGAYFFDPRGKLDKAKGEANDMLGAVDGILTPTDNLAAWAESGLDALVGEGTSKRVAEFLHNATGGLISDQSAHEVRQSHRDMVDLAAKSGARPGVAGSIGGSMVGTLPYSVLAATVPGGASPFVQGGMMGALESKSDTPRGVATDAGIGAVGGKFAHMGLKAAGATIAPRVRSAVQRLLDQGVELTPGEITGGGLHKVEDAIRSFPFIGDLIVSSQKRGVDTANRAAANQALNPIGDAVPKGTNPGHDTIDYAQRQLSTAYDELLPRTTLRPDRELATDMRDLRNGVMSTLPAQQAKDFDRLFREEVLKRFGANGTMDGQTFKEVEEILSREVKGFSGANAGPHERKYADAVKELQDQLREGLARSNPDAAKRLRDINTGYSILTRIESAAAGAPRGVFTGRALKNATVQADKTARHRASARGDAILQPHAEDMMEVMTPTIPDSGTATRGLVNAGATAALFGGAQMAHMTVNPVAAAGFLGALAPYTKVGGAATRAILTKRPPGAAAARRLVDAAARPAASATAASLAAERAQKKRMAQPNAATGN